MSLPCWNPPRLLSALWMKSTLLTQALKTHMIWFLTTFLTFAHSSLCSALLHGIRIFALGVSSAWLVLSQLCPWLAPCHSSLSSKVTCSGGPSLTTNLNNYAAANPSALVVIFPSTHYHLIFSLFVVLLCPLPTRIQVSWEKRSCFLLNPQHTEYIEVPPAVCWSDSGMTELVNR